MSKTTIGVLYAIVMGTVLVFGAVYLKFFRS